MGPPGSADGGDTRATDAEVTPSDDGGETSSDEADGTPASAEGADNTPADADDPSGEANGNTIRFGQPIGPLAVGGFASDHPAGANFGFGDGSVRYISQTISIIVYQQLGNRHDGMLIQGEF